MKTEPLTIDHAGLLFDKLKNINVDLSEYSFSNLFLFRQKHDYKIIHGNYDTYIGGITYDGITYIMPTSDLRFADENVIKELKELSAGYGMIFPVPDVWLPFFENDNYEVSHNVDDADYVFSSSKLATFPGRKLHGKRNLLHQFMSLYTPTMKLFDNETLGEARKIMEIWQNESGLSENETDYKPTMEALDNFRNLKLCGAVFYTDGSPSGFLVGEEINNNMYGIHFAKARKDIKGIYQYMFSQCSSIHIEKYEFINLEQDMGKETLRSAKSSYQPDRMAAKYRLVHR